MVGCIQFRAPTTGIYASATMLTSSTPSLAVNKLGMAIYSNLSTVSLVDGFPTHGIPSQVLTSGNLNPITVTANAFYTIPLAPAFTLTANTLYWFVYGVNFSFGTGSVFSVHAGYNTDSNSNFRTTSHFDNFGAAAFQPITLGELTGGGSNGAWNTSAWFRLS
jgi:hypothetical protein